ncbi:hypothetical protein ACAX46_004196 [Providencia rettgeri]
MFIIFGWLKENYKVNGFIKTYCYNCDDVKPFLLETETEWVTFFSIKTIPFLSKRRLFCERCGDEIGISNTKFYFIKNNEKSLGDFIENSQLEKKTDNQRKYLIGRRNNKTPK